METGLAHCSGDQAAGAAGQKIAGDEERPRNSVRTRLFRIAKPNAPLASIPEKSPELGQITRGRYYENFPNARDHQNRQRIIDHRFVVNRQ
jgi:hypothetical protein